MHGIIGQPNIINIVSSHKYCLFLRQGGGGETSKRDYFVPLIRRNQLINLIFYSSRKGKVNAVNGKKITFFFDELPITHIHPYITGELVFNNCQKIKFPSEYHRYIPNFIEVEVQQISPPSLNGQIVSFIRKRFFTTERYFEEGIITFVSTFEYAGDSGDLRVVGDVRDNHCFVVTQAL